MEARDNHIYLTSTDLEVSAKIKIEAHVFQSGIFCINARNFFDTLKELPPAEVELVLNENENILKLQYKEIHFSFMVFNNSEFPQLAFESKNNEFILTADSILEYINKTSYAISMDETRSYLNGIFFQKNDNKLRAVATDGHRLALLDLPFEQNIEILKNGIIIPRKGITELKRLAENFPMKEIKLSTDDSFLYANGENTYQLAIRLVAREYPKYQTVIPNKTSSTVHLNKAEFFDAVKRVKIMANEKTSGVRVTLKTNEIIVYAKHHAHGEGIESIPVKYDGKEMEIGFNSKYLMDTLSTFNEGEIIMELNNIILPVVVRSESLPGYLCIIMPLKL
jgi:DNA polymerase-3 subunit beta